MWHRIASVAECPPGQCPEAVADDRIVDLYKVDGEFFTLDGVCAHPGGLSDSPPTESRRQPAGMKLRVIGMCSQDHQ